MVEQEPAEAAPAVLGTRPHRLELAVLRVELLERDAAEHLVALLEGPERDPRIGEPGDVERVDALGRRGRVHVGEVILEQPEHAGVGEVAERDRDSRFTPPSCHRRPVAITYNQMVVSDLSDDATWIGLFHALADATRRDILRRSIRGELSVSRLAESYSMSFAAVQKHVAVLERAGLITKQRHGRQNLVRTDAEAVRRARRALDQLEADWLQRVDLMSDLLAGGEN